MTHDEILNKAADLIEERGHWQGGAGPRSSPRTCAFLAIKDVERVLDAETHSESDAVMVLMSRISVSCLSDIFDWNDRTPTAEVLRVLRNEPEPKRPMGVE